MGVLLPRRVDMGFVVGYAVFIFLLFTVLNLSVGFAAAVLLGYGPQPWYALFLPSNRDNVIHIDAIDTEEAETEKPAPAPPRAESTPNLVSHPFPEMNEPEDLPSEPESESEPEPVVAEELEFEDSFEPIAEEASEEPTQEKQISEDEDNELEEYLAGRKDESKISEDEASAEETTSEIASVDDIESMFAASLEEDDDATPDDVTAQAESDEDDELDDKPLNQDDIATLFNS